MLEPTERLARLIPLKHQQSLRKTAEQRRAMQAGSWGLREHAAQLLLELALSPAHQVLLNMQPELPKEASHS